MIDLNEIVKRYDEKIVGKNLSREEITLLCISCMTEISTVIGNELSNSKALSVFVAIAISKALKIVAESIEKMADDQVFGKDKERN